MEYVRCNCGAITVYDEDGNSYSCDEKKIRQYIPNLDLRRHKKLQDCWCCDHCVNHYGLDLCACGSGEPYQTCDGGTEYCGTPMQVFGRYTRVIAKDTWII
ncbi:MAG: hypothetical protein II038_14760 [Lachnospiraceae bacterium]|nr:hypothetical protein [Lachnospiraceae bacterium]